LHEKAVLLRVSVTAKHADYFSKTEEVVLYLTDQSIPFGLASQVCLQFYSCGFSDAKQPGPTNLYVDKAPPCLCFYVSAKSSCKIDFEIVPVSLLVAISVLRLPGVDRREDWIKGVRGRD